MSKKQKIGIAMIAIGAVGAFGIAGSDKKLSLIIGAIILIGVGGVLFFLGKKEKAVGKSVVSESRGTEPVEQKTDHFQTTPNIIDGKTNVDLLPIVQGDLVKVYQYKEKLCTLRDQESPLPYIQEKVNSGCRQLEFEFEPDNPFDSSAIAVKLDGVKIGYVYRGQTQDMIHDYHNSGYEVAAHINTFTADGITYNIGFYKPKSKCKEKRIPFKRAKLAEVHCDGDILEVEYDSFDECYKIYDYGDEFKLPSSVEEYASKYHSVPAELANDCTCLIFYR